MNKKPYNLSHSLSIKNVDMLLHLLKIFGQQIERLDLHQFSLTDSRFSAIVDYCPNLKWVIMNQEIGDKGFAPIQKLRSIQKLYLTRCTKLTDAVLEHLKEFSFLQKLGLVECRFSDSGLESLKGLTGLEKLDLSACPISDQGLQQLMSMRNLQELRMSQCKKITFAGLKELERLPNLQRISFYRIQNFSRVQAIFTKWKITWDTF